MGRLVILAVTAAAVGACDPRSLVPDASGSAGSDGTSRYDGGPIVEPPPNAQLLSDFEDVAAATIVRAGTPPRNGYWYTYNDGSATCSQAPVPGGLYIGTTPPTLVPGAVGFLSLHAVWSGCDTWGAGVGADINTPLTAGGVYMGPKVAYDLTPFTGITFWAMATPGTDTELRLKLPMRAETRVEDGGSCVESSTMKCSDDWGEKFSLPSNGNWKQVTLRFSDQFFQQEGWGALFPWNPADVTSIQIQSIDKTEAYDFWIDDIYLFR